MREIQLTQGKVTLVDDDDYAALQGFNWYAYTNNRGHWYAVYATGPAHARKTHSMHRIILDAPTGLLVDHKDGDGLNNQRCNLRLATRSQNVRNRRKPNALTSTFKGVSWYKPLGKWLSRIMVERRAVHLGYFLSEIEAARAYDEAALRLHGEFANPNFRDAA